MAYKLNKPLKFSVVLKYTEISNFATPEEINFNISGRVLENGSALKSKQARKQKKNW
jgi:hypothetical protein